MTKPTPTIVVENATVVEPVVSKLKKFIPTTKTLLIGAGVAAITIAGAVWFAVKRQDEDDFESELAELNAENASNESTAV